MCGCFDLYILSLLLGLEVVSVMSELHRPGCCCCRSGGSLARQADKSGLGRAWQLLVLSVLMLSWLPPLGSSLTRWQWFSISFSKAALILAFCMSEAWALWRRP